MTLPTIIFYTKKPDAITAIQFFVKDFESLLEANWISGRDRNGYYIERREEKQYLNEGDYIVKFSEHMFKTIIYKDTFEASYVAI